jgi:hypothetical protein
VIANTGEAFFPVSLCKRKSRAPLKAMRSHRYPAYFSSLTSHRLLLIAVVRRGNKGHTGEQAAVDS